VNIAGHESSPHRAYVSRFNDRAGVSARPNALATLEMERTVKTKLLVATLLIASLPACSGATRPADRDFDAVELAEVPLLTAGCVLTSTVMTVTVKDGESAFLSLRPSDSMIVLNGHVFSGTTDTNAPCQIASNATVQINADTTGATHTLGRSVILDYINGLFLLGAGTVPGIKIDFTVTGDNGALNTLKVRGSEGNDIFSIGAGTGTGAAAVNALNVNAKTGTATTQAGGTGGGTVTLDAIVDVTFKNISSALIIAGPGDDRIDGSGTAGVGTSYPNPLKLFGGDGLDTLIGGLAADRLNGGPDADTLSGCAGDDVYDMGIVPAGADIIAEACTTTLEGIDTVDYSARTGSLSVNLSRTLTATNAATDTGGLSGEASGDGAHISDKVLNIKLGAGDDSIVIDAASTLAHKVSGGPGDDSFTGGLGADQFDGQAGDDTCIGATSLMDYRLRTTPVSVSICASGCGTTAATDANDGELAVTRTGTGAATVAPGAGINLVTLTGAGFTSASLGNTLTLSGCTSGAENGAFQIVKYVSASAVKIDVGASSGFASSSDTCNYSETHSDATTNPSSGTAAATLTVKHATGSVTGLDHTTNWLGQTLTLTHTTGAATDDGSYAVLKVLSASSVAIDETSVSTFAGGSAAMTWSALGPEHDNVQCGQVFGGSGNDLIVGDSRANVLRGGPGDDILVGGAGNDLLYGEAGADAVYGGAGNDIVTGGGGTATDLSDTLVGGDGNDTLQGDAAADMFQCDGKNSNTAAAAGTAPGDLDLTTDFTPGVDTGPGGSATAPDCN
jgi:Ca2+-binding RTX toxin-like protein